MDELLWAGNNEHANEFKNYITEDTQTVNPKFKKMRDYDSYHNYCATTNSEWAAQVDRDDRRFAPINCDDKYAGAATAESRDYFSRINDPKEGPYSITLSFAKYLYEIKNLDKFEPTCSLPNSEGRRMQIEQSFSAIENVAHQILTRGHVVSMGSLTVRQVSDGEEVVAEELFAKLQQEFATLRGFPGTYLKFYQAMHKVLGPCIKSDRRGKRKTTYKIVADLASCRRQWNKYVGYEAFEPDNDTNLAWVLPEE